MSCIDPCKIGGGRKKDFTNDTPATVYKTAGVDSLCAVWGDFERRIECDILCRVVEFDNRPTQNRHAVKLPDPGRILVSPVNYLRAIRAEIEFSLGTHVSAIDYGTIKLRKCSTAQWNAKKLANTCRILVGQVNYSATVRADFEVINIFAWIEIRI